MSIKRLQIRQKLQTQFLARFPILVMYLKGSFIPNKQNLSVKGPNDFWQAHKLLLRPLFMLPLSFYLYHLQW
jgi:hypothetical protein